MRAPVEQVVTEDQAHRVLADERLADQERLGETARCRLLGVGQVDAEIATVAERGLERRTVARRADQEDVLNAAEHQRAQRVVDHRLVVDREQLLAHRARHRIEARTRAAGKDDALHDVTSGGTMECRTLAELAWPVHGEVGVGSAHG
jgi:hypothetical protein